MMARRSQKCENQNIVSAGNNVDKRPFIQAVYIHLKETDGIIIGVIPHKEFRDGWRLLSARPPPTLYGFRRSSSQKKGGQRRASVWWVDWGMCGSTEREPRSLNNT